MDDVFVRHDKVAFQFSGGRDSLAALYLMRPYWDRFTVYHIDSGDQFPETKQVVDRVAQQLPRYVKLQGDVKGVHSEFGLPSDIVPTDNTGFGRRVSGHPLLLQDRYDCCFRTVMLPMYLRMKEDGITAIIRGVRKGDYKVPPTVDRQLIDGFEIVHPIEQWTAEQVMEYLSANGIEPPPFYAAGLDTTLECMSCSAWWDNCRSAYLKEHHPKVHDEYVVRLSMIRQAVLAQLGTLASEVKHG